MIDKHDQSLKEFGYLPGGYIWGKCRDCKAELAGVAKYSTRCRPCAVKAKEAKESAPSGEAVQPPAPPASRYGVDVSYMCREISALVGTLDSRPGDEIARYLRRLADVVDTTPTPPDPPLDALALVELVEAYGLAVWEFWGKRPGYREKLDAARAALLSAYRPQAQTPGADMEKPKPWAFPKPDCDLCKGSGFYGNNGPGRKGNSEYIRCDCTQPQKEAHEADTREAPGHEKGGAA